MGKDTVRVCCLNYKGKEVEGCELKLHKLTADKKLRKVRWSPLSETGQKSNSMFATIIRPALFYTILFHLFRTEFFQYPDAFKNWGGGVFKEDSQQNHQAYVLSLLFLRYNETCGLIRAITVCASNL